MELLLHIGMPKTGTTSIQNFLADNRQKLNGLGALYPVAPGEYGAQARLNARIFLGKGNPTGVGKSAAMRSSRRINSDAEAKTFDADFTSELEKSAAEKCIISSEHFWSLNDRQIEVAVHYLRNFFEKITVAAYLRPQDEFAVSAYRQKKKTGTLATFEDHLNAKMQVRNRDYLGILTRWNELCDHIIVRVFERPRLLNGDVVADFCALADVEFDQMDFKSSSSNLSLDDCSIAFINELAKHPLMQKTEAGSAELLERIGRVLAENSQKTNMSCGMGSDQTKVFMAGYEEANKQIVDAFMPNHNGPLFQPKTTREAESFDELELSVDSSIDKSSILLKSFYEIVVRLREENHLLRRSVDENSWRKKFNSAKSELKELKSKSL